MSIHSWMANGYERLHTAQMDDSHIILQALLTHRLHLDRSYIMAHPETIIPETDWHILRNDLNDILDRIPLPYVLGSWEFYGHRFIVTPETLIPRPETELIVETALQWLNQQNHINNFRYIDVGTGSGCIPVSILYEIPGLVTYASDIRLPTLNIARLNSKALLQKQNIHFVCADLLNFTSQTWNLVTANLPYIPTEKLSGLPVSRHEPVIALDGGSDGLKWIHILLEQLKSCLTTPGLALLEFEIDQSGAIQDFIKNLIPDGKIEIIKDLAGIDRILRIERI